LIDFFFGKPRSGKTYRAVDLIYKEYISTDKPPKFTNILTNIGGFKFKEINEIFLNRGSKSVAYKLHWNDFYTHLSKMYEMAMQDKSDDELNRYAYSHKINDCLIILDEASLYMKKYDDVISWYLAYHGHFKVRIIIIAQSPKQINPEYLSHTEIFYVAQPQSKQLTNNQLRYIHYSDIPFSKDNKFSSNTIKTSQDVYNLYKSGEVDKPKKIIYKFIGIALFALIFIALVVNHFVNNLEERVQIDDENSSKNSSYSVSKNLDINKDLVCFRCDDKKCWLNDSRYQPFEISRSYLKFVLLKKNILLSYYEVNNEIYKVIDKRRGQEKITLASLTDYYYLMSQNIKDIYFADMFILKKQTPDTTLDLSSPFSTSLASSSVENDDKRGAP